MMSDLEENSHPASPATRGHELTDVRFRPIGLNAIGLVLLIGAVLLLLDRVFWSFDAVAEKSERPRSQVNVEPQWRGPLLQAKPQADLVAFRRGEDQRLSSFGWLSRKDGVGRIPITDAMKLLAERGFPEPSEQPKSSEEEPTKDRSKAIEPADQQKVQP